jgi:pimeloyl-ACP methyl ester carboxylesterase
MRTQQPFSTHAYQHAATKSGNIAYREAGSGPATILVHGHLWDPLIERLAGSRRCIAIDLLAHGATAAGVDQDLSFDAQAAMLAEFCGTLNLEQVDIVANDSGGGITQIFAARHPGLIRSLVLTDCDTHDNWPPKQAEPLHKLAKEGGVGPLGRRMLEDIAFARTTFAPGFEHPDQLSAEHFRTWLWPLFRSQAPTLIVWGTSDAFFPVKWAYWLRGAIPGAREVIELEGAKLFFPWERAEEFASVLRDFWQ